MFEAYSRQKEEEEGQPDRDRLNLGRAQIAGGCEMDAGDNLQRRPGDADNWAETLPQSHHPGLPQRQSHRHLSPCAATMSDVPPPLSGPSLTASGLD